MATNFCISRLSEIVSLNSTKLGYSKKIITKEQIFQFLFTGNPGSQHFVIYLSLRKHVSLGACGKFRDRVCSKFTDYRGNVVPFFP